MSDTVENQTQSKNEGTELSAQQSEERSEAVHSQQAEERGRGDSKEQVEDKDDADEEEEVEGKEVKKEKKVDLLTVKVESESVALNVLIGFIGIAQRRGTFAVNESAKIYEAIQFFMSATGSK